MIAVSAHKLSKNYLLEGGNEEFCALKEVSFNLKEGESVGIIGRNGAGKSTLLKLLSGVTFPSSGEAEVVGTFSSLLEVGTGFHPDLSGRDNIYLNASILGLSRREVEDAMADIVAFSGVEKFLDQPLRNYSSGMKLRLAFSVIAHLNTDIIALDEVLAVGDSMFQIQCVERIFDFKKQGRTILFVSHNLSAVKKLCERTIVLQNGEIVFNGRTDQAITFYLNTEDLSAQPNSKYLKSIAVESGQQEASINLEIQQLPKDSELDLGINIRTNDGIPLYHFSNRFINKTIVPKDGKLNLALKFKHQLKPGNYVFSVYVGQDEQKLVWMENAGILVVAPFNPYGFHNADAIQGPMISEFEINQS